MSVNNWKHYTREELVETLANKMDLNSKDIDMMLTVINMINCHLIGLPLEIGEEFILDVPEEGLEILKNAIKNFLPRLTEIRESIETGGGVCIMKLRDGRARVDFIKGSGTKKVNTKKKAIPAIPVFN